MDERLTAAVRAATGRDDAVIVGEVEQRPLLDHVDNMTTERIDRLRGRLADGTPWSLVVKELHPASCSPLWADIPEQFHAQVLTELHWLDEPRLYRCGLAERLPDGVRMPRLLGLEERPERVVLWLEHVADVTQWDLARYGRAARALGRMAGRFAGDRVAEAEVDLGLGRRPLHGLFFGKVCNADLVVQSDDAFWDDPAVAAVVDARHRTDIGALAAAMPMLLDRVEQLPSGLCHGDASTANLLEPGDGTVVAIDWSYGHVGALGGDLAQLLAGRVASAEAGVADIEPIAGTILDAYCEGLGDEGIDVPRAVVEEAFATHLAMRVGFSALIPPPAAASLDEPQRAALLRVRAALGRFAIDTALQHVAVA